MFGRKINGPDRPVVMQGHYLPVESDSNAELTEESVKQKEPSLYQVDEEASEGQEQEASDILSEEKDEEI